MALYCKAKEEQQEKLSTGWSGMIFENVIFPHCLCAGTACNCEWTGFLLLRFISVFLFETYLTLKILMILVNSSRLNTQTQRLPAGPRALFSE